MGRPPAYIFIVRHGNRLDAADKLWHLSSPTPYDPPLTYGGWSQSRAIGQRIADILRESTPPESAPSADGKPVPKKRRYKIVIHSSPFLRCIQTSIAISSGIASDSLPLEHPRSFEPLPPLRIWTPMQNGQTSAPTSNPSFDPTPKTITPRLNKSVMRLDAFLGEWLSPGYFELITPPPSSVLMVASAKAELLRREDYSSFSHTTNHQATHAHSHSASYLWGATRSNSWTSRPSEGGELPRSGSQHIPPVEPPIGLFNNTSADGRPMSSNGDIQSPRWDASRHSGMHRPNVVGYVAPVPQFAMSSRAPTPSGYVAHARDACVDFDYQWDSMRAPYDWGDGGEFGEEWAAMHRRFRKGLQKLVDWYSITDAPAKMVTNAVQFRAGSSKLESSGSCSEDADCAIDDNDSDSDIVDDDCIEETVVVLVSHGAGCNALIGAITQQPVLMDVGLASLSVAVRRHGMDSLTSLSEDEHSHTHNSKWSGAIHRGHPDGVVPLNKYFEMKLLANSDHLRSVPTTPTTPRGSMASVIGGTRGRHSNSLSGTPGNFNLFESGVVGHRSSSAGYFHGGADLVTRRPSGASSQPPLIKNPGGSAVRSGSTNGRGSSGITIGSGVLTFSPPTITTTSRMSHSRPDSVGLWSPVSSAKDPDEDNFDFSLTDEGDSKDDDDMEILLSFGPESPKSPPQPEEKKKKAPSIRGTSDPIYPSSLSIAHSADGDHDDHSERTGDSLKIGYKGMSSALPRLDTRGPTSAPSTDYGAELVSAHTFTPPNTSTTARAASPSSPSLWIHPRVVSLNSDELPHEMTTSKRRWTVTEPPV
ncbi:phosphoglycerate mutase family protein [Sporothrix brasiliensis 5110]|uniref:Phosphoglycerate mutase family protein n=1 Tax=Sporothrix brasiliensis 5110 TaxID=1398154 RepID=A0A0C2IH51_9PEZI|nr:phosphoglycerate mutase family protein [Sporothrix brasiliensis 5110]KIH86360.1 phosphoglycerate mutase family protein [Sporothrix brasiliensis 5110]